MALRLLDELDLDTYRYFHSTRADLLRRLGDSEARGAYWALTDGLPFLLDRQGDTVEIFELVAM